MISRIIVALALAPLPIGLFGCSGIERTDRAPSSTRVDISNAIEVPPILQGTISSEAILDGYDPVVVHGYGLVVGLNGSGSSDIPPAVRAHMIAMAARRGIGSESSGWGSLSPEALLDSFNTAGVVGEGVIPPRATEGRRFDIRIFASTARDLKLVNGTYPDAFDKFGFKDPVDPWGNLYEYLLIEGQFEIYPPGKKPRQDRFLRPVNRDFDIYSRGPDGETSDNLTDPESLDDVIRANDGGFIGLAEDY